VSETAAAAVERLLRVRLSVEDVLKLTDLDQAALRRLRQAEAAEVGSPVKEIQRRDLGGSVS